MKLKKVNMKFWIVALFLVVAYVFVVDTARARIIEELEKNDRGDSLLISRYYNQEYGIRSILKKTEANYIDGSDVLCKNPRIDEIVKREKDLLLEQESDYVKRMNPGFKDDYEPQNKNKKIKFNREKLTWSYWTTYLPAKIRYKTALFFLKPEDEIVYIYDDNFVPIETAEKEKTVEVGIVSGKYSSPEPVSENPVFYENKTIKIGGSKIIYKRVPKPSSDPDWNEKDALMLLVIGFGGILFARRRRY
jgi:hypothetical protein